MGGTLYGLNVMYTTHHDDPALLPRIKASADELKGTERGKDNKLYQVWWVVKSRPGVEAGKYLVDDTLQAREYVDPGIGGRMTRDAAGNSITKFHPAQPELFATLIKGIMERDLPWGLIIIGAMLAIVMQLCGVSALAFSVGVYLPLATTLPIFVGGMVRKLVDTGRKFSDEEADMSAGTLMSTGLIAGGSIAGIIATSLGVMPTLKAKLDFAASPSGGESFKIWAPAAFGLMVAVLLAVGMIGKRPISVAPETGDKPQLGEIGETDVRD